MTTDTDVRALQGRVVLVKSLRDQRNPPSAMRGWLEVYETDGPPEVAVALEFPQMFMIPAHRRTFRLDAQDLSQLLASECNGTFAFTIDEDLL